MLNDGREVRLAAIEVAPWIEPPGPAAAQGARAAAAALEALAAGDEVALRRAESAAEWLGWRARPAEAPPPEVPAPESSAPEASPPDPAA